MSPDAMMVTTEGKELYTAVKNFTRRCIPNWLPEASLHCNDTDKTVEVFGNNGVTLRMEPFFNDRCNPALEFKVTSPKGILREDLYNFSVGWSLEVWVLWTVSAVLDDFEVALFYAKSGEEDELLPYSRDVVDCNNPYL